MFIWGLLAGLTHGFRQRRPWEGWWGAFNRACNVVALFFVALMLLALGLTLYEEWWAEPRAEAKRQAIEACASQYMILVPVQYPGGPEMMHAPDAYARCGAP